MKKLKACWSVGWRVGLCLLLLFWIFHTIFLTDGRGWAQRHGLQWSQLPRSQQWQLAWSKGPQDLWQTLRLVQPGALLLSVGLLGFALWLGVVRWRMVLAVQGLDLSLARATRISLVAQFFNAFLLGSTGGDLIKSYYAARQTHHRKTEAVTTVFVDRLIGLWGMLLFAAVMLLPNLEMIRQHKDLIVPALMVLSMLVVLTVILFLAFWGGVSKRFPRARHYLRRLPKAAILERSLDSCRRFGKERVFLVKTVALSLAVNVALVLQIWVLGIGLNLGIPLTALMMIVPFITCVAAIPITPNGLGLRENLFVLMLAVLAVAGTDALSLSLLASAEGIFWSVVGGFVYMGLREKEHLSEVTAPTAAENN
jgi:uncharacterized protein (TIRG00374 family)